mmetsp:Transcript_2771/g.6725  ORF Transcript_2771/g.6725 Transcript_2771/m.6725 type:complete len:287 (+) Transcript_2771:842-1702(+)
MITQLIQDFVHLKRSKNGLNQHGGTNGSMWNSQRVLRICEHVVPQACLEVALHLREVEIGPGALGPKTLVIVVKVETEIEQTARADRTIDLEMLFVQVPSARTSHQCRLRLFVQHVLLALGASEFQISGDGPVQADLSLKLVVPSGRVGVLKVAHVAAGTAVQRVDHHLGAGWPRDLHAAVHQIRRDGRNLPITLTDFFSLLQKLRLFSRLQPLIAGNAGFQKSIASALELAVQRRNELKGIRGDNRLLLRSDLAQNLDTLSLKGAVVHRKIAPHERTRTAAPLQT